MARLTDEQLEQLRLRLLAMNAQIEALLRQTEADTRPVAPNSAIGRLTRMDAIQMQAAAQMNRRQLENRLQQVVLALGLMDQGKYGLCRHCKAPISLERLRALPGTPLCVDCRESFERKP